MQNTNFKYVINFNLTATQISILLNYNEVTNIAILVFKSNNENQSLDNTQVPKNNILTDLYFSA